MRMPHYGDRVIFQDENGVRESGFLHSIDLFLNKIFVIYRGSGVNVSNIGLKFSDYRKEKTKGCNGKLAWRWENKEIISPY